MDNKRFPILKSIRWQVDATDSSTAQGDSEDSLALAQTLQGGKNSHIFTVTSLNQQIRLLLEQQVGEIVVQGEISNFSRPASGHIYFTLKDASAQIRCVFFRHRHSAQQSLQNGQQIVAEGMLSVYEARGDYQLIVSAVKEAGLGDLHVLFERLKLKLAAAGLFDTARKKPLPRFPGCIGVITSATGAALRDILTTLSRRFPQALVLVYPCDVQGKAASGQLINALMRANHDLRCDVLILARGGGSIEDLWAFNDEQLAYAIAGSQIPVVTGVGHETDFTIADFVADRRAATPTAAAELVTPDYSEWMAYFQTTLVRLQVAVKRCLQHQQLVLKHSIQTLTSPDRLVATYWQKLDYLERRLHTAIQQILTSRQFQYQALMNQLSSQNPRLRLIQVKMTLQGLETQALLAIKGLYELCQQRLQAQVNTLNAVSPLATLERGYALVMREDQVIADSSILEQGDKLNVRLAKGQFLCQVLDSTL